MKRLWLLLLLLPVLAFSQVSVNNLPLGGSISGTDYSICDQSGTTNKCTLSMFLAYMQQALIVASPTPGDCTKFFTSTTIGDAGAPCGSGSGTGSWSALTGGTNSAAAMLCGTGCSLAPTAGGFVTANAFNGVLPLVNGGTGCTSFISCNLVIFSGAITSGHCTQWSATGTVIDSGAACGSGSSSAFASITSSTNTSAAMVCGTGCSIGFSGSGTNAATTALAAASTPGQCTGGQFATGVASSFNANCSTPTGTVTQRNVTSNDTMVIGDANNKIYINCASACTETIPANASVAFIVPTRIHIYVSAASAVVTLQIVSDTLTFSPVNATGPRTLAAGADVYLDKDVTTAWHTTGTGET